MPGSAWISVSARGNTPPWCSCTSCAARCKLRAGERGDIGEALEKTAVIRNHRGDLGLLQHDFGDPDAVGIARALPRQVVAAVALVPGEQTRCEIGFIFDWRRRTGHARLPHA